jgi:hypothetical protein
MKSFGRGFGLRNLPNVVKAIALRAQRPAPSIRAGKLRAIAQSLRYIFCLSETALAGTHR